jgi:predicted nucleic acid-binding protein
LILYLDASVLVALLTADALSARADALLRALRPIALISDLAEAEFASAVARRVRTGEMATDLAHAAFANLDIWRARSAQMVETEATDVRAATTLLRRVDLPLRTADAINIAIARRAGARLATFDATMAIAARALGVDVIDHA